MKSNDAKKIAIFGGSFDPPHYGHYDIVKNLEKIFDRVIVVPTYISPFKSGADGAADAKLRLKLCREFFTSQKTEVCDVEIKKKGISYSVDTAAYLKMKEDGEYSFVIGSEELKKLDGWHEIDRLKTLVSFFVVPRPGFMPDQAKLKALKKRGIKIKFAKFDGLDISSTELKIDIAFGKKDKCMPFCVRKAVDKGAFDPYGKYVEALYRYKLTPKRIEHSYGVAKKGAELAKLYGGSTEDAVIACILHDIAKSVDRDDYKSSVDLKGFPEPTEHAPIGAYIAKRDFAVGDEIAHAIFAHTTGDAEMSLLDEIVYLADKTEDGRNYKEVYYFRYLMAYDKDIAMLETLKAVSEFKDSKPCKFSKRAIELYEKRCAGKKTPEVPPQKYTPRFVPPALGEVKKRAVTPAAEKKPQHRAESVKEEIAYAVAAELSLRKARDIDIVDLAGKTIIADYFVLASASSTTAVKALNGYVEDVLTEKFGLDPLKRDVDAEWVALDYGSVIVHIFTDKTRAFYNIERLWSDGKNVKRFGE